MNRPLSTAEEAAAIRRGERIDTGTRDYLTTTAPDGTMLDKPIPADCHVCGRPIYYDSVDERWHHATAPEVACRYLPSEPRPNHASDDEAEPPATRAAAAGDHGPAQCKSPDAPVCLAWTHREACAAARRGDVLHSPNNAWVVIVGYQPDNEANDGLPAVSVHPAAAPAFDSAASTLAEWLLDYDDDDAGPVERADGETPQQWYARLTKAWEPHSDNGQYVYVVRARQAADGIQSAIGRAAHALAAYRVSIGDRDRSEPIDAVLGDLFTDLRHWVDAAGADIYAALERSYDRYLEERRDPAYAAAPPCPHCGDPLTDPDGTGWAERCPSCDGRVWFCPRCGAPEGPTAEHACEPSGNDLTAHGETDLLDRFPSITSRRDAARFFRACAASLGHEFNLERPADSYVDDQGRPVLTPEECETFHLRRQEAIAAFADAGEDAAAYCLALVPPGGPPTSAVYDLDSDTLHMLTDQVVTILNRQGWHAHVDYGTGPTDIFLEVSTGHVLGFTVGDEGIVGASAARDGALVESGPAWEALESYRPAPLGPGMTPTYLAVVLAAQIARTASDFLSELDEMA